MSNTTMLRPEDDTQELWQLTGRVEALRDWLIKRRSTPLATVYIDDVAGIMGFDVEGERHEM